MRKRYLKYVVVILFVIIFCQSIYVYNSNNINSKVKQNSTIPAKTTIRLAMESSSCTNAVKDLIAEYNIKNEVKVSVDIIDFPAESYDNTINMLMTSGIGPDVFFINDLWLKGYILNGWLVDVGDMIDKNKLLDYPSWVLDYMKNQSGDDKIFTFPSCEITYRLIYNKDLFKLVGLNPELPPTTFQEFKDFCIRISNKGKNINKYGYALSTGDEWTSYTYLMEAVSGYSGLYFYNYNTKRYDLTASNKWFEILKQLKNESILFPVENSLNTETVISQFREGNVGMMIATSKNILKLIDSNNIATNWGVAYPPLVDKQAKDKGKIPIVPDMMFGINHNTKNMIEAKKLWSFLYSDKFLSEVYKSETAIPLSKKILEDDRFKPKYDNFLKFLPGSNDKYYFPILNDDMWFREKAYREVFDDTKSVDGVLEEYTQILNLLLDKRSTR